MVLNIIDSIVKFANDVKEWMTRQDGNWLLMLGIVLGGLGIFLLTYNALHKEK